MPSEAKKLLPVDIMSLSGIDSDAEAKLPMLIDGVDAFKDETCLELPEGKPFAMEFSTNGYKLVTDVHIGTLFIEEGSQESSSHHLKTGAKKALFLGELVISTCSPHQCRPCSTQKEAQTGEWTFTRCSDDKQFLSTFVKIYTSEKRARNGINIYLCGIEVLGSKWS